MRRLQKKIILKFQKEILTWFNTNKRDLPWRKTRDPYKILVSEVMLQQTQVSRVILKYTAWLVKFPTVQQLAKASVSDVLRLWSGLGYNRRALYLKRAAESLIRASTPGVEPEKIVFPQTEKELRKLPGIGEYTARALLCFAFDKQIAVVDTNVRKVILHRFFKSEIQSSKLETITNDKNSKNKKVSNLENSDFVVVSNFDIRASNLFSITDKEIQNIADQLLPKGKAYDWNQALMDYSSAMLRKEKVPTSKQSRFIGSNRYFRGQIIKILLKKKEIKNSTLLRIFSKENLDSTQIEKLLYQLDKDGLIKTKDSYISLAE